MNEMPFEDWCEEEYEEYLDEVCVCKLTDLDCVCISYEKFYNEALEGVLERRYAHQLCDI